MTAVLEDVAAKVNTIYVAGPMSPSSFGIEGTPHGWNWNHPAFNQAASDLRAEGHTVINPAEMDVAAGDTGDLEWHEYLRRDLKVLADCDRIVMLPGWMGSKGARLEHFVAIELGMTVDYLEGAR